jgi:hypothetical protein
MAGEYDKSKYTKKERFQNFWYYNKLYIIFAVLVVAFLVLQIHKTRNQPKIAFNVMFFNVDSTVMTDDFRDDEGKAYVNGFMESMGIDTRKNTFDTQEHVNFSVFDGISESEYLTIQNMGAYGANGDLDVVIANDGAFEYIAYWEALEDLRSVLDAETLKKLEPHLYYVDQAVIDQLAEYSYDDAEFWEQRPDGRHPDAMLKPIPVGIYIDKPTADFKKNFNVRDMEGNVGGTALIGVYINTKHPELCRAFIDYILE